MYSQRLSEVESDYYDASKIGSNSKTVTLTGNNRDKHSNRLNKANFFC